MQQVHFLQTPVYPLWANFTVEANLLAELKRLPTRLRAALGQFAPVPYVHCTVKCGRHLFVPLQKRTRLASEMSRLSLGNASVTSASGMAAAPTREFRTRSTMNRNRKTTQILLIIAGCFAISWLPYHTFMICKWFTCFSNGWHVVHNLNGTTCSRWSSWLRWLWLPGRVFHWRPPETRVLFDARAWVTCLSYVTAAGCIERFFIKLMALDWTTVGWNGALHHATLLLSTAETSFAATVQ